MYALKSTRALLQKTKREKEEQHHLVEKHVFIEKQLLLQAQELLNVANTATDDVNKLHDRISRSRLFIILLMPTLIFYNSINIVILKYNSQLEQENQHISDQFRRDIAKQFQDMENNVTVYTREFIELCTSMKNNIGK